MADPKAKRSYMPPTIKEMGDPRKEATWSLFPVAEGLCSQCEREHAPEEPHDAESLRYHYAFYAEHGVWPTWGDALAHCDPEVREAWAEALRERGVAEKQLEPRVKHDE